MMLPGRGILISSMQVLPEEDADFNEWFDKEHLPERVAIPGFIDARRYESLATPTRYFQVYNTVDFATLDSPAYRHALAHQTGWSNHHIARFVDPTRVVGRLVESRGFARGAALVVIRLRPGGDDSAMLPRLGAFLDLLAHAGVTAVHCVEGDPGLSRPVVVVEPYVGGGDAYVLVECSSIDAATRVADDAASLPLQGYGERVGIACYRYRLDMHAPVPSC